MFDFMACEYCLIGCVVWLYNLGKVVVGVMMANKTYELIFYGEYFDFRTLRLEESFSNNKLDLWTFRKYFGCMQVHTLGPEESFCV